MAHDLSARRAVIAERRQATPAVRPPKAPSMPMVSRAHALQQRAGNMAVQGLVNLLATPAGIPSLPVSDLNDSSFLDGSSGPRFQSSIVASPAPPPKPSHSGDHGQPESRSIHAKLRISKPGDADEQEADRVADAVMRVANPPDDPGIARTAMTPSSAMLHRLCSQCEEGLSRQRTDANGPAFDGTGQVNTKHEGPDAPRLTETALASINAMRAGGSPLPSSARAFFEDRLGADLGDVRLHTDSRAAETASSINARAFTVGRDIAFGPGQYSPESHDGRRLLAHELTHVLQQNAGASTRASSRLAQKTPTAAPSKHDAGGARSTAATIAQRSTSGPFVQGAWYDIFVEGGEAVWGGVEWAGGKVAAGARATWRGAKWLGGKVKDEVVRVGGAAWECAKVAGRSAFEVITLNLPSLPELLGMPAPVQGSPIGTMDVIIAVLKHPCLRMIPGYTLLAKGVNLVQEVYGFLKGAWKVLTEPEAVVNAIREALGAMMSPIPDQIRGLAQKAITFSDPPPGHLNGIWRHLEPKLEFIGAHWWEILKQTASDLVWPWPGVAKDLGEIWEHIKAAGSDIWDAEFSSAVDHLLAVYGIRSALSKGSVSDRPLAP